MPGRRAPRRPDSVALTENTRQSFRGGLDGAAITPDPVGYPWDKAGAVPGDVPKVQFYQDEFAATGGSQQLTLTFLPVDYSERVFLCKPKRGLYQREEVTWTRESGTREVITKNAMNASAGDFIVVEYAYYSQPAAQVVSTIPTGPKFWYKMDEPSGATTAIDSAPASGDFSTAYWGSYTLGAAKIGRQSGETSLETASAGGFRGWAFVGAWTAGAWINTTQSSGRVLTGAALGAVRQIWFEFTSTTIRLGQYLVGPDNTIAYSGLNNGVDHLIVSNYKPDGANSSMDIWVDGQNVGTMFPHQAGSLWSATENYQTESYTGRIADLIGWDRTLADQEIRDWYGSLGDPL